MIDLSVAIVAYKDYGDVIHAVTSLERYTSDDLKKQVYIIDNSSGEQDCDALREEMLACVGSFSDVTYLDAGGNLGFGKGNNLVIPMLDSRYHAIVNPDILFTEDVFSKLIRYMEDPEIGMCIPKLTDENGRMQWAYRRDPTVSDMFIRFFCKGLFRKRVRYHALQDHDFSRPFQVPFGQGSFLVIRTDLFRSLGGFDERFFMYMEDADLCRRVNQVSKLMYYPYASVIHKWNRKSHRDLKMFRIHFGSMRKYFKKWGFRFR